MSCSTPGHEEKPEHGRSGLCQACYRRARRRELDPQVGTRKPGPAPDPNAPRSRYRPTKSCPEGTRDARQRLSDEEKEARRAARKAAKTHCVHGHELTEQTTYVTAKGQKVCRLCQRRDYQRYKGREVTPDDVPLGPRNSEKTHCKWGHDFTVHGYVKRDGSRGCRPCHRESRLMRVYGLERGEYDRRFEEQSGHCAICDIELEEGRNLAVDHDHETGAVRGLLCDNCNRGLGYFGDDPDRLRTASKYVKRGRI